MNPVKLNEIITLARERDRARSTELGKWQYLRFIDRFKSVPEGTTVFGDTVIWGYPKIGRILQLQTGIAAQFKHPFWIEEKVDGYNVRIFRYGDDILALTRRGYICPFTTDRLSDLLDTRIFAERPELVLCAEVAGPENPYNEGSPPFISEDIQLFVFDVMRQGRSGFFSHPHKMQLLETYGLPGVTQFGRCQATDLKEIKALVLRLNEEGREGIIFKEDSSRNRRVKYVTGNINISDIRVSERGVKQLPSEFFVHRVLRLALFLEEHGIEPTPAIYQELGESMVTGILDAIHQYRGHHKVFHTYRCRFRQHANVQLMLHAMERLLGKGQVRQHRLEKEGEFFVLEFDKVMPKTTGMMGHILGGGTFFD